MRFFPGATWNSDPTTYWAPNIQCVKDMLAETEFSVVRVVPLGNRALFDCAVTSRLGSHALRRSSGVEPVRQETARQKRDVRRVAPPEAAIRDATLIVPKAEQPAMPAVPA